MLHGVNGDRRGQNYDVLLPWLDVNGVSISHPQPTLTDLGHTAPVPLE
jgi:hypothetical protein